MKHLLIAILTSICLLGCQPDEPKYILSGSLPSNRYDGEWIYLAPLENASNQNIDSARIENARFTFEGKGEAIKVLRMRVLLRLKLQELLVVTEPGTISVRIDSISSASGTPQNDALQRWKERKQTSDREARALWTALKRCAPEDSIRLLRSRDSLRAETQAYNLAFLKEHINHTAGKFLYKMIRPSLTGEQQKELDEISR